MKIQKMFKESITKEELTDLPLKWFKGEIVLVDTLEKVKYLKSIKNGQMNKYIKSWWN